jgi:hypothetical protein
VGLKPTDDLLVGRDVFALQHPSLRWVNCPLNPWQELGQFLHQALGRGSGLCADHRQHVASLAQGGARDLNQFGLRLI